MSHITPPMPLCYSKFFQLAKHTLCPSASTEEYYSKTIGNSLVQSSGNIHCFRCTNPNHSHLSCTCSTCLVTGSRLERVFLLFSLNQAIPMHNSISAPSQYYSSPDSRWKVVHMLAIFYPFCQLIEQGNLYDIYLLMMFNISVMWICLFDWLLPHRKEKRD